MRLSRPLSALAWVAALIWLAGCSTGPTAYAPQAPDTATGYSDEQLTATRFRVTFKGNAATDRETVENYLLYRAAEVTVTAGYNWFVFDTRNTNAKTTYLTSFTGWPGWGGYGWYWHSWDFDGPWRRDPLQDAQSRPITRFSAYAEIVLLSDEAAKREPKAINAKELMAHLGPMVKRPEPPKPPKP